MDSKEIIILLLFGAILVLLILFLLQRNKYKKDLDKRLKAVREDTDKEILNRTLGLLRLSVIPFLWAMRSELMKGDLNQIDQYFNQYVKEPGIAYVAFIENNGNIRIATNKKTEGRPFSEIFPETLAGIESISIIEKANDEKLILAPVTGLNEKLGSIAVVYHPREV